jgi:hypothetical protein
MRSLDFPAALADGLDALRADGLRGVEARLGHGATLVLMGWRPLVPAAGPSAAVTRRSATSAPGWASGTPASSGGCCGPAPGS